MLSSAVCAVVLPVDAVVVPADFIKLFRFRITRRCCAGSARDDLPDAKQTQPPCAAIRAGCSSTKVQLRAQRGATLVQ